MAEANAAVVVTFNVTFDFTRYFSEAELADEEGALATLRSARRIEGSLDIAASGAPTTRVIDELAPWVQNLCFRAVPPLAAGEPARVSYYSRSGSVLLTPRGDVVELSGDLNPAARYPKRALLVALVECGHRFLTFAAAVKRDSPDFMGNLNYIRRFEGPAREALAQRG
jgi:hypothetical protein